MLHIRSNPKKYFDPDNSTVPILPEMHHPSHETQLNRLRIVKGQVRGLQKMIEDRRYCMDIVSQLRAVSGALKQVELGILETHLQHCVQDALNSNDASEAEAKIQEIVQLLKKN